MLFEVKNITPLKGIRGLYFIFSSDFQIQYPFGKSKLLCIGMSEKKDKQYRQQINRTF
jgi:hypothetical protein